LERAVRDPRPLRPHPGADGRAHRARDHARRDHRARPRTVDERPRHDDRLPGGAAARLRRALRGAPRAQAARVSAGGGGGTGGKSGARLAALAPVAAVLLALAAGGVMIAAIGESPFEVYGLLVRQALGTGYGVGQTLFKCTPLLFAGLSVALAFRAGL